MPAGSPPITAACYNFQLHAHVATRPAIMSEKYLVIAHFDTMPDVHIALGRLNAVGIEGRIADQHLVQTDWLYSIAVGGIKLSVEEHDRERALAVLEQDYSDLLDEDE